MTARLAAHSHSHPVIWRTDRDGEWGITHVWTNRRAGENYICISIVSEPQVYAGVVTALLPAGDHLCQHKNIPAQLFCPLDTVQCTH